jgi:hypothetical protein
VLDNDSDPQGYILSITSVTAPDNASAKVFVAPDGQTIQITLGSDAGSTHFRYTIDDGKGLSATASVTVESHSADQNVVPNLRPGFVPQTWNVVAGGSLVTATLSFFSGPPPRQDRSRPPRTVALDTPPAWSSAHSRSRIRSPMVLSVRHQRRARSQSMF